MGKATLLIGVVEISPSNYLPVEIWKRSDIPVLHMAQARKAIQSKPSSVLLTNASNTLSPSLLPQSILKGRLRQSSPAIGPSSQHISAPLYRRGRPTAGSGRLHMHKTSDKHVKACVRGRHPRVSYL